MSNTPFLTFRLATPADAEAVQAIYAPYIEGSATSFELEVPSVEEIAQRITQTLAFYPWLVAMDGGTVVGYAYASQHRVRAAYVWAVDVSVYIAASHHRRGVGRALYEQLFALLRRQGFYTAIAGITLPNPSSIGLHEAMGFTPVGVYHNIGYKDGAWRDVGWWELALQPPSESEPVAPLGIQELA